jgi:NADH dehydrogenase
MPRILPKSNQHQVVIVGGGFGGLSAAKKLSRSPVQITLIDKRNFHLFQPLLYQIASGALSPANIAAPLRQIFSRQRNCRVVLGEVLAIDSQQKTLTIEEGTIPFDTLILAAGSTHSYFGNEQWEPLAPALKTIEDATRIRSEILVAFERAELETDADQRRRLLTFVIVGGGPTGVELAGAVAEIALHNLSRDFRAIDSRESSVYLVEAGDRLLDAFPKDLSQKASASLERLGVVVRCNTRVVNIEQNSVTLHHGKAEEVVPTATVLWAAGVKASGIGKMIAAATGVPLDRAGRVIVEKDLSLPGHPDIFVIGDLACYQHGTERPLPGLAPVAMQEGRFVAKLIDSRLRQKPLPRFRYRGRGNLATIGRSAAVADFRWIHLSGWFAWVLWLVVHLIYIITFRNRLLVLIQWSWSYLTYDRSARLITNPEQVPIAPGASGNRPSPADSSSPSSQVSSK